MKLPYGKGTIEVDIPTSRLQRILESSVHTFHPQKGQEQMVMEALEKPIGTLPLRQLAKGKNHVVLISSDHTRPVPSHIITPILLNEIRQGNPDARITILVATGFHRATSKEELIAKYGSQIVEHEEIVVHDSEAQDTHQKIGTLPSGGELIVNRLAVDADLLIAEGFIEPHFFAGFSGGRKSVLPGIASTRTVLANHCSEFIASDQARTGILEGNPIHRDMLFAASTVGLAFILNVVIDAQKQIVGAFAGHFNEAHLEGAKFLASLARVAACPADLVIVTNGGYPFDQNIYQAVKGMTAAEACCNEGAVIIMLAECADGHGGQAFRDTFAHEKSAQKIMADFLTTPRDETIPDQWESQILARILLKHPVIMVTQPSVKETVEAMHMTWASTVEEAIQIADVMLGKKEVPITLIPDGVSVIVSLFTKASG